MTFLVNDLSLHGQFRDTASFRKSVALMMQIRNEILRCGSSLYCNRNMLLAQITPTAAMQQALQGLLLPERLALIQWLTTNGPYWEDMRMHGDDDWVEVNGDLVTQSAIGEATVCRYQGRSEELVSFSPSRWNFTPVHATWVRDGGANDHISIPNHWELPSVIRCLEANPQNIESWAALGTHVRRSFTQLIFAENAFQELEGHPFFPSAAERIRVLLHTLNRLKACFGADGKRSTEGHTLYTDHFTGEKAWFSDSSDAEKRDFEKEMTFLNPGNRNQYIFCPWHGKVKTPQIRIHFTWPVRADIPLYIMYIGPKITRR